MYYIDVKNKKPLHIQLYEAIKEEILFKYQVGDKLSSIRKVAKEYNLSKTTVESAYSQLVAEGYIESIPQSGYVVSAINHERFNEYQTTTVEVPPPNLSAEIRFDFFPARLHKNDFPLKTWRRLFNQVITNEVDFGSYPCGLGEYGLRKAISNYLSESRGVKSSAEQIIICNGFSDSMQLIAKLLQSDFSSVAMENPGYHIAKKSFESVGFKIDLIPVQRDGISISKLEESNSRLVYVTPSHQYPTGVATPISKRWELLSWAKVNNGYIIEDDYDSELRYTSRPIPALQGLDTQSHVIYVGTFSKSLSPALRISYLVLPMELIKKYNESYESRTSRVCLMTQKVLEVFIQEGHWKRHLNKIRTSNKKKHDLMQKLLIKYLDNSMEIVSSGGGLAILIRPCVSFDWQELEQEAQKLKLKLYYAKERSGGEWQAIMMGFGGLLENELEEAIVLFSKAWEKALKGA